MILAVLDATAIALIAALAAPIVSYVVAARRFSGKIETSDAKELWAESRSIREWSQARIAALNEDVERLEARIRSLESHNAGLNETIAEQRREIENLHNQIRVAETKITVKTQEIAGLEAKLKTAKRRVDELEAAVGP